MIFSVSLLLLNLDNQKREKEVSLVVYVKRLIKMHMYSILMTSSCILYFSRLTDPKGAEFEVEVPQFLLQYPDYIF